MMSLAYFPFSHLSMTRLLLRFIAFILFADFLFNGHSYGIGVVGVAGRAVTAKPDRISQRLDRNRILRREDTPTDVCKRWSQQTAVVNGTIYIYGGRSMTESSQKDNTWSTYIFSAFSRQLLSSRMFLIGVAFDNRQWLLNTRLKEHLGYIGSQVYRPPPTIRPPARIKRIPLEFPRISVSIWGRVFR